MYHQESNILTKEYLNDLIKKDNRLYYPIPELNDRLYLHYKGF
jgi:hypothetical protein